MKPRKRIIELHNCMPTTCVLHELDQNLEGCKGNKMNQKKKKKNYHYQKPNKTQTPVWIEQCQIKKIGVWMSACRHIN